MGRLSVILNSELPSRAVAVYLVLNEYADKNGYCFPSLKTIAQGTGLSKSTVKRAIQDLTEAGFIQRDAFLVYVSFIIQVNISDAN